MPLKEIIENRTVKIWVGVVLALSFLVLSGIGKFYFADKGLVAPDWLLLSKWIVGQIATLFGVGVIGMGVKSAVTGGRP